MDVTRDEQAARTDAAWQRAWDQLQTAIERRQRVGKTLDPFALLELMEEVHEQMREELQDEPQGPPIVIRNEDGELDEKVAADSYRAMIRPKRDDDYGASIGQ